MAKQHLTDREIQDFLDENVPQNQLNTILQHLNGCVHCQHHIEQYRKLYTDLAQEVDFELPPNFAESIVTQISPKPVPFWQKAWFEYLIWILGIGGGIGLSIYSLGWAYVLNGFKELIKPFSNLKPDSFSAVQDASTSMNLNPSLLGITILGVILVFLFDYFILKPRFRPNSHPH